MIGNAMILSKSFVRLLASIVAAMLLLCQTTAAALAYGTPPPSSQGTALSADAATPCHHAAQEEDGHAPAHGYHDRCPARDGSLETAKVHLPEVAQTVWRVLALMPPLAHMAVSASHTSPAATATPPPLTLLFCRLLN